MREKSKNGPVFSILCAKMRPRRETEREKRKIARFFQKTGSFLLKTAKCRHIIGTCVKIVHPVGNIPPAALPPCSKEIGLCRTNI